MQPFKIEHYEAEHGSGTFMPFRHLPDDEAAALQKLLLARLGLDERTSPIELVQFVLNESLPVEGFNAEDEGFSLSELLESLQLKMPELIYLNWHRFDDIDEVKTDDLIGMFDHVWYPAADDLDLVDQELRWLLSIHHSGALRVFKMISTLPNT